jgi:ubiquinone/menaquinone biosynthesis C-methylase UbiE
MNSVVNWYEKYDEENRLSCSQARKVEFIISTQILDNYINSNDSILDVASGTGIYSFYYAKRGHNVFSTDITPKHIQAIKNKLSGEFKGLNIKAEVANAIDLSMFDTNQFNTVLCMGPIYHLIKADDRKKCINECLRVLKKGGLLAIAYINKYYLIPHLLTGTNKFVLHDSAINKVIDDGIIKDGEEDCFWTDSHFTTPIEMEEFLSCFDAEIIDHVAADGLSPLLRKVIDAMSEDEYKAWLDYQLKTCREKSVLGISNHGLILCRKI